MLRSVRRLPAALLLLAIPAFPGIVNIHGTVSEMHGPNYEGIAFGDSIWAYLDYTVVDTPFPGWDDAEEPLDRPTLAQAVETQANEIADLYLDSSPYYVGRIDGSSIPAWWVIRALTIVSPYGVWDLNAIDYSSLYFDSELNFTGFSIGGDYLDITFENGDSRWFAAPFGSYESWVAGTLLIAPAYSTSSFAQSARFQALTAPVPEPATWSILGIGLAALAWRWRAAR